MNQADRPMTVLLAVFIVGMVMSTAVARLYLPRQVSTIQPRSADLRINVNTADPAELTLLPGIGLPLAQRIVEHRKQHGPFRSASDLQQVQWIGPAKVTRMSQWITCEAN